MNARPRMRRAEHRGLAWPKTTWPLKAAAADSHPQSTPELLELLLLSKGELCHADIALHLRAN